MQIQKEDIRNKIITVAREEFIDNGFRKTSMRNIAKKANVGLGNIYNYFKNKNEIFCEIVQPLLLAFDKLLEDHNSEEHLNLNVFTDKNYQKQMVNLFIDLLRQYRFELKLLLFQAGGSSLENFKNTFADDRKVNGEEYMEEMHKRFPGINCSVSPFFRHIISSTWLTILGEVVSHEELSEAEIELFYTEYVTFNMAGWKDLMKV